MGSKSSNRMFLTILFLCSTFYFYGNMAMSFESSYGMAVMPLIILVSYFLILRKFRFNARNFFMALTLVFLVVLSYVLVGGGLGSVVNNLSSVIYIFVFYELVFQWDDYRYFAKLIYVFQLYLFFYTLYNRFNEIGYIGVYNPNTIGMQSLFDMVIINMFLENRRGRAGIFMNAISVFLILYTRSRTAFVSGVLILLYLMVSRKKKIKGMWIKIAFWAEAVFGICIAIAYVWLARNYNNTFTQTVTGLSLRYFKKNIFTGRESLWAVALDQLGESKQNLLLGIGSHYISDSFGGNFHNSFFTIIICCGLVTYILMMTFLFGFFNKPDLERRETQRSRMMYLALMVIGFAESTLFAGHFAIMGYLILSVGGFYDSAKTRICEVS